MPVNVSIPNVVGNFYGGQPYAIDLNINFDSPSTLKISVFNENGNYGTPNPNYSSIQTITIGNMKFVGYLVEYSISEDGASKILELEYEDCSSILDRMFVGLHKRHGLNPQAGNAGVNSEYFIDSNGTNSNVIIVGHEILKPFDNSLNFGGYSTIHIHDVGYYFNELLTKLGVSNVSIPNVNYVKDYPGSLRDVLSSWCADYGLTYYWEFGASTLQTGLKFFDLKNVITIASGVVNNCEITNRVDKVSARGTLASGEVAYYDREGGAVSSSITQPPQLLTLTCLTIGDLYNDDSNNNLSRYTQLGIALSYYSQSLRDLHYWFNYRQIFNENVLLSLNNTELNEFALSNIVAVYSDSVNSSGFSSIKEFGSEGDTIGDKSDKLSTINGLSYYFFVAKYNEEQFKAQLEVETRLAEEFLGRHWIRSFDVAGRKPELNVQGPGMDCEYIDHMSALPTLPFANYGHQAGTYIGNLVQEGKSSVSLQRSIIYGNRTGMWYPNQDDVDSYKDTIAYYDSMAHRYIDAAYDNLFTELGLNVTQAQGYGLFIAFKRSGILPVTYTSTSHFLDQNQMTPIFAGDENNTIVGYCGLKSNSTYWVTFDGFKFMAPCGALMDASNSKPSLGGSFVVSAEESKDIPFEFTSKKLQYTNSNIPDLNGVARSNINFNNVSGDDISQIRPFVPPETSQQADQNREVDVSEAKSYVKNALNKTSFRQTTNSKFLEFTLAGLPNKDIQIRDGLDSLSIRVDENGVFTEYAYSDKLIKAQEADEVRRLRNMLTNYNGLNNRYMGLLEQNVNQQGFIQQTP